MAHDKGSFDYKIINEKITKILDNRARLNNTVQLAMPFVKATTTIQHPILGDGNIGFTLGLHAIDEDVKYEDIYSNQSGTMPLIGYTYDANGTNQKVYAQDANTEIAKTVAQVFDRRASLFTNTNFIRMPPPGITQVTVGRNKNGLLASGQLKISVPSLIQLESLHKTFLVPGLGMVLEWGQQFAVESLTTNITGELPDISYGMFPWHNRAALDVMLKKLAKNEIGMTDILKEYVYPTNGQYMWMFGRVANFNIKSNSDGSFDCDVKIVGPSEDSWAYSTRNTVVPAKDPSAKIHCAQNSNSIFSYFTDTTPSGLNLKSLLDQTISGKGPWKPHVVTFTQGNRAEGKPDEKDKKPTTDANTFADSEDAYFMSWKFFVNVVLNDETYGVKAIFKRASLTQDERDKIGTLLPYDTTGTRTNTSSTPGNPYIDDPMESFVGLNKYLRSIDPSVLIIVNERAVSLAKENPQYKIASSQEQDLLKKTEDSDKMSIVGWFDESAKKYNTDLNNPDRGFLSTGVWINHKAVVESMVGGETLLRGIVNLLERMNAATSNYWQLTIDAAEPDKDVSPHSHNYMVVDANFRNSADKAVSEFLDNVYTFNKYVREDQQTGELVGSELIDCSVDLSLPKRLFSQIATLGLIQPDDLTKANAVPEGQKEDPNNTVDLTTPTHPRLSDPNDTLREMFAITTLYASSDNEQGPDLTILPKTERKALVALNAQCTQQNAQTTANTAGVGNLPNNPAVENDLKGKDKKAREELKKAAVTMTQGKECEPCNDCGQAPVATTTTSTTATEIVGASTDVGQYEKSVTYNKKAGGTFTVPVLFDYKGSAEKPGEGQLFAAGYRNGRLPASILATATADNGTFYMYRDAADAFNQMRAAALAQDVRLPISNTYRTLAGQIATVKDSGWYSGPEGAGCKKCTDGKGNAAQPGASNHGWGLAIDFQTMSYSSKGYLWLNQNANKFGFFNIAREPWHWEYRTPLKEPIAKVNTTPSPAPAASVPATTTSNKFAAVFVTGLTDSIPEATQIAAFKAGLGKDKRIFTAPYTNSSGVKQFLAQNPKTPVFLYSAGAGAAVVNGLIDDPNLDKQKLFLIEPYLAGDATRAAIVNAIQKGLPAANVYGGPTPQRGGGDKRIPGSSVVPAGSTHQTAPTYVGQQRASLTAPTEPKPITSTSTPTPTPNILGSFVPIQSNQQNGKIVQIIQPSVSVGNAYANVVKLDTGTVVRRIGSRNWRNNNPGNLAYGDFAKRMGAVGSDGRFAIFPDYQTGRKAKEELLFNTDGYKNKTVSAAIARYAPAFENDTTGYTRAVINAVGGDFVLNSLNPDQRNRMLDSMQRIEGYAVGKVEVLQGGTLPTPPTTPTETNKICETPVCKECARQKEIIRQIDATDAVTNITDAKIRQFPHLQNVFRYVEMFTDYMVAQITDSADGNFANAFGSSPGSLAIKADLTLPGINGLRVGELFWVDRIPVFYKAFGAFQIMSIQDDISINGWQTKLHAQFNFLGKKWKESMVAKLTGAN